MNVFNSVAKIFFRRSPKHNAQLDLTEYKITTTTNEYLGVIIYQDDFLIKFRSQKNKTLKILKSNISKISIVPGGEDAATSAFRYP